MFVALNLIYLRNPRQLTNVNINYTEANAFCGVLLFFSTLINFMHNWEPLCKNQRLFDMIFIFTNEKSKRSEEVLL